MTKIERCLKQVGKIRDVASGQASPYVARSRIGRLVVSLSELTADNKRTEFEGAAAVATKIQSISKSICQPSEPLDTRWRLGWSELLHHLDGLEGLLKRNSRRAMN